MTEALRLSILVGALGTALALPPAVLLGRWLARSRARGRVAAEVALMLPLVLPPVVTGYALLLLLGRRGPLGGPLHGAGVDVAFTTAAAVLAAAVTGFPLALRACRAAFEQVDPRLESVARTLGAGPVRAFVTVTLPLARAGVVAAGILCFARSLGEFGATMVFAGNIEGETRTLPLLVYTRLQSAGGLADAWAPAAASVVVALLLLGAGEVALRRGRPGAA